MSDAQKTQYKINLTVGALHLLRDCLGQAGWTKKVPDIVVAGQLLAEVLPDTAGEPGRPAFGATPDAMAEWKAAHAVWATATAAEFVISEKQRDNVKLCLNHHSDKSQIPPSKYSFELFVAFGLSE